MGHLRVSRRSQTLADGLEQGINEAVAPPPSSLLTWTRADCTDGVGRDQREFGLRPGSLPPALLDSWRRDTPDRP